MKAELRDDGRIWFESNYAERSLVRSLPGARYDRAAEQWSVEATWTACLTMRSLFGSGLQIGLQLESWAWSQLQLEKNTQELNNSLEYHGGEYDPRLFGYQQAGAEFMAQKRAVILGDEPGLGKTAQSISAVKRLHDAEEIVFPLLIIAPNSMKRTWLAELQQWWPEGAASVTLIGGSAAQRRKQLADNSLVHIINWESVRLHSRTAGYGSIRLKACADCGGIESPREDEEYKAAVSEAKCEKHERELNRNGYRTVIADEAHRMANPNAKQTRSTWSVVQSAEYRFLLTGTPVGDNVADIWSLLHALDKESFPVRSKFLDVFARTQLNFFGGYEVLGLNPRHAPVFGRVLSGYLRRTPKSLALPQLPPKLPVQYRYAEMSPRQAKQYKQMKDGFLTLLASGKPVAASYPITQVTLLRQIACAMVTEGPEGKIALTEPSCKVDDLVEFVSDNPGQLVVAAKSRLIMELAERRLTAAGLRCGMITGGQTLDERHVACQDFQAGKLDIVLMTMQAGGVGITLTAADTMYFLERGSSVENKQAEDRVHRIGSEIHDAVRIVSCVTAGTLEDNKFFQLALQDGRIEEVIQDAARLERMLSND